jgi:hypothetical protein
LAVTGIWAEAADGRWRALPPVGFAQEQELHDLIERSPAMLPLAGAPRLVILGREVRCGTGRADLVAVDAETGTPVVIEIKLASNTDRRAVLTQVLGYAAHLRRLDMAGFEALLAPHLAKLRAANLRDAVTAAVQDPAFDTASFTGMLADALAEGRFRCAVVIDAAPPDLIELVGYLQDVTNDRLALDLITVTAYQVADQRVLVPQLVEPDRTPAPAVVSSDVSAEASITKGPNVFADAIEQAAVEHQPLLRRLHDWARQLEADGLAVLYSSTGRGRWVLNPRLPGQQRGLITIWNERGASIAPYRTVFTQEAPGTLAALDEAYPEQIRQGNYLHADYDDQLLRLLRAAYEEARDNRD